MIVKIGLIGDDNRIIETHWFHSSFNVIVYAMSPEELARSVSGEINIAAPARHRNANPEALVRWATHDWGARLASLPAGANPFSQSLSDGRGGAPIIIPRKQ
jgi:hypothetical protein